MNILRYVSRMKDIFELRSIIRENKIRIVYQPLICLSTGEVFGYEALSRGPYDSSLSPPAVLFPLAEEAGMLYPLEKVCREQAIINFQQDRNRYKLFLNINPQVINDPQFTGGITMELLQNTSFSPQDIVFELTERTAIKDFVSFKKTLEHYRRQGFLIAIDDAGAGYSSLQAIAELKPDFIKLDMSLIKDIDKNPIKQALLETFLLFSKKINARLIAEGIEQGCELEKLIDLGIDYGQGFFLAKPDYPLPTLSFSAQCVFTKQTVINF